MLHDGRADVGGLEAIDAGHLLTGLRRKVLLDTLTVNNTRISQTIFPKDFVSQITHPEEDDDGCSLDGARGGRLGNLEYMFFHDSILSRSVDKVYKRFENYLEGSTIAHLLSVDVRSCVASAQLHEQVTEHLEIEFDSVI